MQLPVDINISRARLPQTYEAAKTALANCESIDECKDWADKAEALASYAKQADDDTLRKLADRIQARAVRRCGELLKTFKSAGGRPSKTNQGAQASSQKAAANGAGLSKYQRETSIRVANVPDATFEALIESDQPPTVTQIAQMGTGPAPAGFKQATHLLGAVRRFAEFCDDNDPELVAKGLMPYEIGAARRMIATIDSWLDRFIVNLGEEQ